jgi:hypothetical protein
MTPLLSVRSLSANALKLKANSPLYLNPEIDDFDDGLDIDDLMLETNKARQYQHLRE